MIVVLVLGGLQMLMLGVLGEYVSRHWPRRARPAPVPRQRHVP